MGHRRARALPILGDSLLPRCGLLPPGLRPHQQGLLREPIELEDDFPAEIYGYAAGLLPLLGRRQQARPRAIAAPGRLQAARKILQGER